MRRIKLLFFGMAFAAAFAIGSTSPVGAQFEARQCYEIDETCVLCGQAECTHYCCPV